MRKQFIGHFKEPEETIVKLWRTGTFVFDANVLLNLYRYSDDTRDDFLKLLQSLKTRSWLPEQAAHEFLKNRATVIKDQIASYKTTLSDIDKLQKSFSGSRAHPFISKSVKKKFEAAVENVNEEMVTNKQKQENLIHNDNIKNQVADLFDGRVGECYTSEELVEICAKGELRYAHKIPPGYKDGGKISDPKTELEKRTTYGDWIIWKQVMDHAKSNDIPIIFVTDDRKSDWWEDESGKTLGPRPELIREFVDVSGQKILIYTPDNFLNTAKEQLKTEISRTSIDEVEAEHSMREARIHKKRFESFVRNGRQEIEGFTDPRRERNFQFKPELNEWFSKSISGDEVNNAERELLRRAEKSGSSMSHTDLISLLHSLTLKERTLRAHHENLETEYLREINMHNEETSEAVNIRILSVKKELETINNQIGHLKALLNYRDRSADLF